MLILPMSTLPILRVDFNEMPSRDLVLLAQEDSVSTIDGRRLQLEEGLPVFVHEIHRYENGEVEMLYSEGRAIRNRPGMMETWTKNATWLCHLQSSADGHDALQHLACRPPRMDDPPASEVPGIFLIHRHFSIAGRGLFLSGEVTQGEIRVGDRLLALSNGPALTISAVEMVDRGLAGGDIESEVAIALTPSLALPYAEALLPIGTRCAFVA